MEVPAGIWKWPPQAGQATTVVGGAAVGGGVGWDGVGAGAAWVLR